MKKTKKILAFAAVLLSAQCLFIPEKLNSANYIRRYKYTYDASGNRTGRTLQYIFLNNMIVSLDSIISVYPNPTPDYIYINAEGLEDEAFRVRILDSNGSTVVSQDGVPEGSSIDMGGLSSGIYSVQVSIDSLSSVKKIIKQ